MSYTTLRRFAHDELAWREPRVTVRVDDPPPGEEIPVEPPENGKVISLRRVGGLHHRYV